MGSMWRLCGLLRKTHPNRKCKNAVRMGHRRSGPEPRLKLLAHEAFPIPAALRRAVLAAMNAEATSTAELARLNWRLGMAYADAVQRDGASSTRRSST